MTSHRRTALEALKFHPSASHVSPDYRDGWNRAIDTVLAAANQASALPLPAEREATILEATQEIRDLGQNLIENDWALTGERLIQHALKIERALLTADAALPIPTAVTIAPRGMSFDSDGRLQRNESGSICTVIAAAAPLLVQPEV
jgi:hypothetical protein